MDLLGGIGVGGSVWNKVLGLYDFIGNFDLQKLTCLSGVHSDDAFYLSCSLVPRLFSN
jgi:hypothetical protein